MTHLKWLFQGHWRSLYTKTFFFLYYSLWCLLYKTLWPPSLSWNSLPLFPMILARSISVIWMVALSCLMGPLPLFPEYVGTCGIFWLALFPFFLLRVLAPWFSFKETTWMSSPVRVVTEELTQQLGTRAQHLALASTVCMFHPIPRLFATAVIGYQLAVWPKLSQPESAPEHLLELLGRKTFFFV